MMTNVALQPTINTAGEVLVTPHERHILIQKLKARGASDRWIELERQAYEKSGGVKVRYLSIMQNQYEQIKKAQLNNLNQPSTTVPAANNTIQYVNQTINLPQQQTAPMLNHPQHQLNHQFNQQQPRFSSIQLSVPTRPPNPSTTMINNQTARLTDPQKFNQASLNPISYSSAPPTIQTIDLSQTYRPQQQPITNPTLSDYLSQPPVLLSRFPTQSSATIIQRPRAPTNLNDNFAQQTATTNANSVLQQYVVSNPPPTTNIPPMTNTSSTGDRLLQQILQSNNTNPAAAAAANAASNKATLQTRQLTLPSNSTSMPQTIRPVNSTNSVNSIRSTLISQQQASPSASVTIMPTQPTNVQLQSATNIPAQASPLNNNNSSLLMNSQSPSVPNNNFSSPVNRSGNGSIPSSDEETIQLIKFLRENITRLQAYCQKFSNEGNMEKARHAQLIYQQVVQFITNPTYEGLPQAKHIRDMLEKVPNRSQPVTSVSVPVPTASSNPAPSINEFEQLEKVFTEFFNGDSKKRQMINRFFTEPLSDVINGVPHKKIRLDIDDRFHSINETKSSSIFNPTALISKLNCELHLLPNDRFSVQYLPVSHTTAPTEFNDEYLSKNGLVLRCKLIEIDIPLVPILRLRIFPRYPEEQPEILSLTKTMPPKLESTDGHPFFERISTIFISHLFKLPPRHTVTDVLNLWYQSIRSAL